MSKAILIKSKKKFKEDRITIAIPAFQNKKFILRCLKSIFNQSYENIEIIISDDCSNPPLKKYIFYKKNLKKKIRYFYQKKNIGTYHNVKFCYLKSTGKFFMIMPHDDYFTDKNYIKDSINLFKNNNINATIFNTIDEYNNQKQFYINKKKVIYSGEYYIKKKLFWKIHPAYSGVIIKKEKLDKQNYKNTFLPKYLKFKYNIEPDEYYTGLIISIFAGKVLISNYVKTVRGYSKNSYSRSNYWKKNKNINVCVSNLVLFNYFSKLKNLSLAFFFFKQIILYGGFYPFNNIIYKIFNNKKIKVIIFLSKTIFQIKKNFKLFYLTFLSPIKRAIFN